MSVGRPASGRTGRSLSGRARPPRGPHACRASAGLRSAIGVGVTEGKRDPQFLPRGPPGYLPSQTRTEKDLPKVSRSRVQVLGLQSASSVLPGSPPSGQRPSGALFLGQAAWSSSSGEGKPHFVFFPFKCTLQRGRTASPSQESRGPGGQLSQRGEGAAPSSHSREPTESWPREALQLETQPPSTEVSPGER